MQFFSNRSGSVLKLYAAYAFLSGEAMSEINEIKVSKDNILEYNVVEYLKEDAE